MKSKRNISVVLLAAMILGLSSGATATLITRVEFEPIVPVTVGLDYGMSYSDIISGLSDGSVRIGMYVIALPDGSSFSAVNEVLEPVTMVLLGLGGLF